MPQEIYESAANGGGRRNVLKYTVEITMDTVRYVGLIEKPGVRRSGL